MKRVLVAIATALLYTLGIVSFLSFFIVIFPALWLPCREIAELLHLQSGGLFRTVVEYGVPGCVALWGSEKLLSATVGRLHDRLDRWEDGK